MSQSPQAPYERVLALGISALELARAGRLDELAACQQVSGQLMASLPASPPAAAGELLARALVVERELGSVLAQARAGVLAGLAEVRRAQRAAAGYSPARERRPLISADA